MRYYMAKRSWWIGGALVVLSAAILFSVGRAHDWNSGTALGVAGLAVSVVGFAIAIAEISTASSKADTAYRVLNETLVAVASRRLAVVITQLRQTISELEAAVEADDANHSRLLLNQWRSLGQDAEGLITRKFGPDHRSMESLRKASKAARISKGKLYSGAAVRDTTSPALTAMDNSCDELGPLLEQLLPIADGERHDF
jgi:hypothetical protein